MKLNTAKLSFEASSDPSTTEHRIRIFPTNIPFSYTDVFHTIYVNKNSITVPLDFIHTNMCSIAITAIDIHNNESDPTLTYLGDYSMAFLKTRKIKFDKSASADVVSYNIRIVAANTVFDYTLPASNIKADSLPTTAGSATVAIDIATLNNKPTQDGTYDVYITAADAIGNESDPLAIKGATFDFTPPTAPTNASIV